MEEEECLAFDDPRSDSNATADGCSLGSSTPREPRSLREMAVEVHARESEVEELRDGGARGPHRPHICKFVEVYSGCNIL